MKKHFSSMIALLLAVLLLVSSLVACNKDETTTTSGATGTTDTNSPEGDEDEERVDANGYVLDDLPESYDWDKDFTVLAWADQFGWEFCEEISAKSTQIENALYKRIQNVEERFNVSFKFIKEAGAWGNRNAFVNKLAESTLNQDGLYDMVSAYTPAAGIAATQGCYADLYSNKYLDFDKPWWPEQIVNTAKIGDRMYFCTGDITPTLIRNIQGMFMNVDMYNNYGVANDFGGRTIYEIVDDGDWTYENMKLMGLNRVDVNGGYQGINMNIGSGADPMLYAAGVVLIENDADGHLKLSDRIKSQPIHDYFEDLQKLYYGEYDGAASGQIFTDMNFAAGKMMIWNCSFSAAGNYINCDFDWTALPMPKLDTAQTDYRTCASFYVSMFSIPSDAKNKEMSGMIMEGLASDGYRNVTDIVYYNTFQAKYMGDPDKARMLDTLQYSVVFDHGRTFADYLNMFGCFRAVDVLSEEEGGRKSWTEVLNANYEKWEFKLESLETLLGRAQ